MMLLCLYEYVATAGSSHRLSRAGMFLPRAERPDLRQYFFRRSRTPSTTVVRVCVCVCWAFEESCKIPDRFGNEKTGLNPIFAFASILQVWNSSVDHTHTHAIECEFAHCTSLGFVWHVFNDPIS